MASSGISTTSAVGNKLTGAQVVVLILLSVSICINYIDRGALGVAAPQLMREMSLNPEQMGRLLSSFFWTYACVQILSGWLVDRYDVRWIFGGGFLIWSAATFATGLANTFSLILGVRLLLGVGESVAYPSYSKILATNFPNTRRGVANALIDASSKMGPAIGLLVGGLLVAGYGWRSLFLAVGSVSLLFLIPWSVWGPEDRKNTPAENAGAPGISEILAKRATWGTFFGLFGANYVWYFLLFWLPLYLVEQRHFSEKMMAILGSVPFWGIALSSFFSGWISDRWILRGGSPTFVRKFFTGGGMLISLLLLPAGITDDRVISMALIFIVSLTYGMCSSNLWAITQTLAGPLASGKWTGLQNAFGNLAGVVAPYLTGWIVNETHSFVMAFVATAAAAMLGALSFVFLIPKVEPIVWRARPAPADFET